MLAAASALSAAPAPAHDTGPEYLASFDTVLEIDAAGAMDVVHTVVFHPHGEEIRRGLFFALPEHVGPLSAYRVTLDGEQVAPRLEDGAIIAAADAPLTPHETHRAVISYRAPAPWWRTSADRARLRWTPVIEQFELPWGRSRIELRSAGRLPPPAFPTPGTADGHRWTLDLRGPLSEAPSAAVGELTFRLPAGALSAGALRRHEADWPWRIGLVAIATALLCFLHLSWRAVGRGPDGVSAARRSTAPADLSPAAARYVHRLGFDERTFLAALVSLRVQDALTLHVQEDGEAVLLERTAKVPASLRPDERELMEALFAERDAVTLRGAEDLAGNARDALSRALRERHMGADFVTNDAMRWGGVLAGLVVAAAAVTAIVVQVRDVISRDPVTMWLSLGVLLIAIVAPLAYFDAFKAPTRRGARRREELRGLERYLKGARNTGEPSPEAFVALLPYAVALDVEESWQNRMPSAEVADADGDPADVLRWYRQLRDRHASAGALMPVLAAASASSASSAGAAGGGASAGGV